MISAKSAVIIVASAFLVLSSTIFVYAQEDEVVNVTYDKVFTVDFTPQKEQVFAQFDGEKGDVIYVQADAVELSFDDKLEIDLRNSLGRSVGFKDEYLFNPFILAELPASGKYTLAITYKNKEANKVKAIIGKSGYLNQKPLKGVIAKDGFNTLFGFKVPKSGNYRVIFRKTGTTSTEFKVLDFSSLLTKALIDVSGNADSWAVDVKLDAGNSAKYVALLGRPLLGDTGSPSNAEIQLVALETKAPSIWDISGTNPIATPAK